MAADRNLNGIMEILDAAEAGRKGTRHDEKALFLVGAALRHLGELGDDSAASLVRRFIDDPDERVRRAACRAAGRLRDSDATASLLVRAECDTDQVVREWAIWSLGELRARAAINDLNAFSRAPDQRIRLAAVGALIKFRDSRTDRYVREAISAAPFLERRRIQKMIKNNRSQS